MSDPAAPPAPEAPAKETQDWRSDIRWATALLFVLVLAIASWYWSFWARPTAGTEDLDQVTDQIFSQDGLVVPFEILSVLLLAALIAGIVIAARDPERED